MLSTARVARTAEVDFSKTVADFVKYRPGFPREFFARLDKMRLGGHGTTALDLGTGTGSVARGVASFGAQVTGIDIASDLMTKGMQKDMERGVFVSYMKAEAEDTGLPSNSVDLITAGQTWHWFDRVRAAKESFRVLKPGGKLVIAHCDWLPLPNSLVAATEELILKHSPNWDMSGGDGFYQKWTKETREAGFGEIESFSFELNLLFSHDSWRGRVRASAGVAAVLSKEEVQAFDKEHKDLLEKYYPDTILQIPHNMFALILTKPNEN